VFKKEFHALGSKSLIAFQVIYRVIEMTGKDSKTSYTGTLLFIPFIQLLNFGMQDRQRQCIKYRTTFMIDYLSSKCFYINFV